jgi:hypothetical protein
MIFILILYIETAVTHKHINHNHITIILLVKKLHAEDELSVMEKEM